MSSKKSLLLKYLYIFYPRFLENWKVLILINLASVFSLITYISSSNNLELMLDIIFLENSSEL